MTVSVCWITLCIPKKKWHFFVLCNKTHAGKPWPWNIGYHSLWTKQKDTNCELRCNVLTPVIKEGEDTPSAPHQFLSLRLHPSSPNLLTHKPSFLLFFWQHSHSFFQFNSTLVHQPHSPFPFSPSFPLWNSPPFPLMCGVHPVTSCNLAELEIVTSSLRDRKETTAASCSNMHWQTGN